MASTNTNIEPARKNGPHESRKDTLLFQELDSALLSLESLLDDMTTSMDTLESTEFDMASSVDGSDISTQNRR